MWAELASSLTSASFRWTFVGLSCIPYALYLVAYIFESRNVFRGQVPWWKGQSKAFLPGDFGLVMMVTTCLQVRGKVDASVVVELLFAIGGLGVGSAVFWWTRRVLYTASMYDSSFNSPSKKWHDFVMLLLFCAALIYVCVPVYIYCVVTRSDWAVPLFGLVVALVLWGGGMVYDLTPKGKAAIKPHWQHPLTWKPIWQRS